LWLHIGISITIFSFAAQFGEQVTADAAFCVVLPKEDVRIGEFITKACEVWVKPKAVDIGGILTITNVNAMPYSVQCDKHLEGFATLTESGTYQCSEAVRPIHVAYVTSVDQLQKLLLVFVLPSKRTVVNFVHYHSYAYML
jgi:hypothetical protein